RDFQKGDDRKALFLPRRHRTERSALSGPPVERSAGEVARSGRRFPDRREKSDCRSAGYKNGFRLVHLTFSLPGADVCKRSACGRRSEPGGGAAGGSSAAPNSSFGAGSRKLVAKPGYH